MRRVALCLLPALGCLGAFLAGCESDSRTDTSSDTVFFGRVASSYEVCFNVNEDFTALTPSDVCDSAGVTPFSFIIDVTEGSDQDGEPCAFRIAIEEPIPLEGTDVGESPFFVVDGVPIPGSDLVGSFRGTIGAGTADGFARVETTGVSCEILWAASTSPVCREDAAADCNLLLTCCQSIYLLPPFAAECLTTVNNCDPTTCLEVLGGYPQCPQSSTCTPAEDPNGVCALLEQCCNSEDFPQEELLSCLETASSCDPTACEALLAEYPECG